MRYIVYYPAHRRTESARAADPTVPGAADPHAVVGVQNFLYLHQPMAEIRETYVEPSIGVGQTPQWSRLHAAITACIQQEAVLLIAVLGTWSSNAEFLRIVEAFLAQGGKLVCADQPAITDTSFHVLATHAQAYRRIHGDLVREGLRRTTARLGNPNARQCMKRINRPKAENAVLFSLLLLPVFHAVQQEGHSQRWLLHYLNTVAIHAPEGGIWRLGQLRRSMDRARLVQHALRLEPFADPAIFYGDLGIFVDEADRIGLTPWDPNGWTFAMRTQLESCLEHIARLRQMAPLLRLMWPYCQAEGFPFTQQAFMTCVAPETLLRLYHTPVLPNTLLQEVEALRPFQALCAPMFREGWTLHQIFSTALNRLRLIASNTVLMDHFQEHRDILSVPERDLLDQHVAYLVSDGSSTEAAVCR